MKHEKTFAAIAKLKDIEVELHRLKNALEIANKALDAEREACAKVCEAMRTYVGSNNAVTQSSAQDCAAAIRARGQA